MKAAFSIKNLSKMYKVYAHSRLRLKEWLLFGKKLYHKQFWALRDINFDVPRGQSLGIIGRNGAGKSSLLKLIAGVAYPTKGTVEINGRVSSLLELGAGFHPEFTGKDNIFMNGALMGLDKHFIDQKYEQIVEFSELGDFINTPIKFYSSGMVVRLGFSVAINMEPEVLIIDEALAVGDFKFQKKCMNAMREFKRQGVTIILVTHSLGDAGSFCDRVILLDQGQVAKDGTTEEVIQHYVEKMMKADDSSHPSGKRLNPFKAELKTSEDIGKIHITEVSFLDGDGERTEEIETGEKLIVRVCYDSKEIINNPLFRVIFYRSDGLLLMGNNTYRQEVDLGKVFGKGAVEMEFDSFNLNQGVYYVSIWIAPDEYSSFAADRAYDIHDMAYTLKVTSKRMHGGGLVYCKSKWKHLAGTGKDA